MLTNEKFVNGSVDTYFIDENPQLFTLEPSLNRAQKLLNYLAEVLVNGPQTPLATSLKPANITPHVPEFPAGEYLWFLIVRKYVHIFIYILLRITY